MAQNLQVRHVDSKDIIFTPLVERKSLSLFIIDDFYDVDKNKSTTQQRTTTVSFQKDQEDKIAPSTALTAFYERSVPYLEYWGRGIANIFQTTYGSQTTPTKLNTELNKLTTGDEWISSEKLTKPFSGQEVSLYHSTEKADGTKFIVTAPAHDLKDSATPMEMARAGELSVKEVIAKVIKENLVGKVEVCVPVAQASKYFGGLLERNHWATLKFSLEDGNIQEANLYDSKGWLSGLYNGSAKIQAHLPENAPTVQATYTGHQGFFNNNDCGRFSVAYIEAMKQGQKVEDLSTKQTTSFFSKLSFWK